MMKYLIATLVAVAVIVGLVSYRLFMVAPSVEVGEEVVCAADVQLCEDGSYVGREAPSCNFAACPGIKEDSKTSVGLQQTWESGAVSIVPREILEDSRCPEDVMCIQAGTVRIKATVIADGVTEEKELSLGQGQTVGAYQVTLVGVLPTSYSTIYIQAEEYRFDFSVTPTTPG